MRILLVGNYPLDNQSSMLRYVDMLCQQIDLRGHEVEIVRPKPFFGNLFPQPVLRKWFGYIDKYLLFPAKLRYLSRTFDLVHVCDHSNSMYLPHTGGRPTSITCHDLLGIASAQGRYPEQNISYTGKVLQRWILKHLSAARNVVCVSANTASELAPHDPAAARSVERNWDQLETVLRSALIRAQAQGELPAERDPLTLARMLLVLMQGLRVVGKASADPARVRDAAEQALALLD